MTPRLPFKAMRQGVERKRHTAVSLEQKRDGLLKALDGCEAFDVE